jgi:lipopolysaccharide transport system permease protein
MSIRYTGAKVEPVNARLVNISFEAENISSSAWLPSEGFAVGYHIFDPETDTLIEDGRRVVPETAIAPGERRHFDLRFELPEQPGEYRVFVSPVQENAGWFYERGWPFLVINGVVEHGTARIQRFRIVNRRTLQRERLLRSVRRAFTLPWQAIWRNRSLIRTMVRRDILGRYRGSFAGTFWTFLNPLILMLTYFFVFGVVLRTRFPSDPSRSGFALYFLAGMLPWLAFSEAAGRAPLVMIEHRNFVKKLVFPVETLPVNLVAAGFVSQVFAILLFLVIALIARESVPDSVVWLPVLIIPQLLFTAGVTWFLAALGVFFRDLAQINGFLLTLWFFLTPICYPESSLPPQTLVILGKNPMFTLVRGYRAVLLEGSAPAWRSLWKLWVVAFLVFILGYAWFYKLRKSFADVI